MSAALICPPDQSLLAASQPTVGALEVVPKRDSSSLSLDPFPLACALVCLLNGQVETTIHRGKDLAVILDRSELLLCIQTVDGIEGRRAPFWIPRDKADLKKNRLERMLRSRRHMTLRAPCWPGEPRPKAKTIPITSHFPGLEYIEHLSESGYPKTAVLACLVSSDKPWMHPRPDRRKACPVDYDWMGSEERDEVIHRSNFQNAYDPEHPYVPMSPSRRTYVGGGFTKEQVTEAIAKHRWEDGISNGVFQIVYQRHRTSAVAQERSLPIKRLYEYSRRVRKDIRSDPKNDFAW